MTRVLNTHRTKIDGEDVERRIRRTLEYTRQATYKRIGTVVGHCIDHHTTCTRARQGLHQGCRHSVHPLGIDARQFNTPTHSSNQHIHCPRGTENADSYEDSH